MSEWTAPSGLRGEGRQITVSLSMLGEGDYNCPMSNAMRARRLYPMKRTQRELFDDFTNGFIMEELDRRDTGSAHSPRMAESRQSRAHEGVEAWTRHAAATYLEAFPAVADEVPLIPAEAPWSLEWTLRRPDRRGARMYRLTLWGRCLQSIDGSYREFRWPSNSLGNRRRRRHSAAERAMAAFVTAWSQPGPTPRRVRVVEFGFLDGRPDPTPLFDGTPEEARVLFNAEALDVLSTAVDGGEYSPGRACRSCRFTAVCPAVPKIGGLLGVQARDRPLRTWSPTSARSYRECPARSYLRASMLPVDEAVERNASAERGRAVHDYLAACHKTVPHNACGLVVPDVWLGNYALADDQHVLGSELLRFHAEVCPMLYVESSEDVRVEPSLVYLDEEASSRVLVQPDLLYRDGDSWVWREVKTSARRRRFQDLLWDYPQLALGLELLGRGALDGSPARSRVELEVLRPGGADLITLDPFSPGTRQAARDVVRRLVAPWREDDLFIATPGAHCSACEVARWCPSRQQCDAISGDAR
ncbi:PD-(D/E)XK nuclease family protein [Actinospica durhamensis]|uniref:PD-(D/E)XK nuclease family protein n=1 Tax=Actinospica durhamensis TaxID=1508375 RepID=A0A941IVC7_9ACTN|nr:PD-(D/E)XK nuclease family protein [Actinospica durhamensis]MBR7836921.1 PD-(D/E)XK nuclease family protein [Actinospica durhamensis]